MKTNFELKFVILIILILKSTIGFTTNSLTIPVHFEISVNGTVNGQSISYGCTNGVVNPLGHYCASLNFSNLPIGFHPIAASTYTMSICCWAVGDQVNGAINLNSLLDSIDYTSTRTLDFPNGYQLIIQGHVHKGIGSTMYWDGTINGNVNLPSNVIGNAQYHEVITPNGPGSAITSGSGIILTSTNDQIPVTVNTIFNFDPSKTLPFIQYRTVTETGTLIGNNYSVCLYSFLNTQNKRVPTLSQWGLIILSIVLISTGVIYIVLKKRKLNL